LARERNALIEFIRPDMWKPYPNVIAKHAPNALNILDRYHIAARMNKTPDEVRAKETRALKVRARGAQVILTHSRWCLLKCPENLSELHATTFKRRLWPTAAARRTREGRATGRGAWMPKAGRMEGPQHRAIAQPQGARHVRHGARSYGAKPDPQLAFR
jgi:hypothetical protein